MRLLFLRLLTQQQESALSVLNVTHDDPMLHEALVHALVCFGLRWSLGFVCVLSVLLVVVLHRGSQGYSCSRPHRLPVVTETLASMPHCDWRRRDHDGGLWAVAPGPFSRPCLNCCHLGPFVAVRVVSCRE